ncbi:sensor histidine kinase [Eudoraea sp.]|uniref:sensor histidine kinase n=1 Tax=Eudoraea sp. TaxID=1979955 RepID=UPI003C75F3EB
MKQYNYKYFEPFIIFALWIILFASPLLFGQFQEGIDWTHVLNIWKNHLPLLLLFLAHRFVLMPYFYFKGKKVSYAIITLALILTGASLIYGLDTRLDEPPPPPPPDRMERPMEKPPEDVLGSDFPPHGPPGQNNRGPIPAYVNFIILAILIVGFDAGLQISMRWANLEQEKFKLQKESVENQLAFLRNQISPHFFMNTLNNIHALVDIDSEEAKQSIVKLSNLMRHLLYDSEDNQNPIKKEVEFIQSYIELMQLRFTDKVRIEVDIPADIPDKSVPPLLFTSLLENAFKHGISYTHPSFIKIAMSFPENRLIFKIENSNHFKKTEVPSGIGLENSKKRMDLLYKTAYDLNITETREKYTVNLSIPI